MHIMGIVTLGLMWLQMAKVALDKLARMPDDKAFYEAKLATAHYYRGTLPARCRCAAPQDRKRSRSDDGAGSEDDFATAA